MKVSFRSPPLPVSLVSFLWTCRKPSTPKRDYVSCVVKLTRSPPNIGHPALLEGGERSQASSPPYLHHAQVCDCHPAAQEGESLLGVAHIPPTVSVSLIPRSPLMPCPFPCGPSPATNPLPLLSVSPYRPRKKNKKDNRPSVATPTTATIQLDGLTPTSPPPSPHQPSPPVPSLNNHPIHGSFCSLENNRTTTHPNSSPHNKETTLTPIARWAHR